MGDEAPHESPTDGLRGRDLIGLGGLLVGSVVFFTVLGYVLDQALDSSPACTLAGIALGMVGGAVGFALRVRAALREPGS